MKEKLIGKVENYNQKGDGVIFKNNKPYYIFGVILGEIIEYKIIKEFKTYGIGEIVQIIESSPHRVIHKIDNAKDIGGYELIHMDKIAQKNFKVQRVINDFNKIAKLNIKDYIWNEGQQKFKYRNKITLHNGSFYKKNSNQPIEIKDFLLSDIQWDKNLKGKIIYRKLDTLIFGKKNEKKYTTDQMLGYKFRVGLNSFYQINKEVAQIAYSIILENVIENKPTLDLYSGIGTISIIVSSTSSKVVAIEWNKYSCEDALFNIKSNNIDNVEIIQEDVKKYISLCQDKFETVILDPSREGIGLDIVKQICLKIKPKRIIYMSCNPATQARDTTIIQKYYKLNKFHILDMFPQTYHIETIAIFDLI